MKHSTRTIIKTTALAGALSTALFLVGCGNDNNSTAATVAPSMPNLVVSKENKSYEGISAQASGSQLIRYSMPKTGGSDMTTATALVFTPKMPAPAGGYPIVAWAHGTTGVADSCAPSASTDMSGAAPLIAALLQKGYVVVAPDYEGLGSDGTHLFLNAQSEANSVIYAAIAAHQLVPNTASKWAVVGHSQGGHAALAAAERAALVANNPLSLQGVVAFAPASNLSFITDSVAPAATQALAAGQTATAIGMQAGINTFASYVAQGLKQLHPEFDMSSVFGTASNSQALLASAANTCVSQLATDYGFDITKYYQSGGTGLYQGLKTDYTTVPVIKQFIESEAKLATRSVTQPILLIQGQADTTVPYQATQLLANQMTIAGWNNVKAIYSATDNHGSIVFNKLNDMNEFLTQYLPVK